MAGTLVDLHIHTDASDGTDSPEKLLRNLQKAGINIFAVTDHDTIRGAMAVKRIVPQGFRFIQGIEFSCMTQGGNKCHILGLNYDENNPDFQAALRAGDEIRHTKFHRRIEILRSDFGITFTDDEIDSLLKIPSVGKPHLANLLVAKGLAKNKQDAITHYIDKCRTRTGRIDAGLAVKAILSSGGIPVWAHPLGGEGERELPKNVFMIVLNELVAYGVRGLECWYSKYKSLQCEWLVKQAHSNGLFISGGSDYHGANKTVPIGKLNAENIAVSPKQLTILREIQGA